MYGFSGRIGPSPPTQAEEARLVITRLGLKSGN